MTKDKFKLYMFTLLQSFQLGFMSIIGGVYIWMCFTYWGFELIDIPIIVCFVFSTGLASYAIHLMRADHKRKMGAKQQ